MIKTPFPKELIDLFLTDLQKFPASSDVSTVKYDTAKLIDILREKEVIDVCKVTKEDFDRVNQIDIGLGTVVRDLVFEKHIDKSLADYLDFEKRIEDETTGDLYIYAKQGALSVKSLYYYKAQNWDKAIDYTVECIALNDYLIQVGMSSLNLRVFEQNKNISRTLFRAGRMEEGYQLTYNLFNYLLNGIENNLYGSIFKHPEYWNKVPLIRETYAYEMFCMLIEDMIWFNTGSDDFFPVIWFQGLTFEIDNSNRQILYNYLYLTDQLHKGNYAHFIESLIFYFNEPISLYYDILKVTLLLEVVKLIRNSDYSEKEYAIEQISTFVLTKLSIADRVRNLLTKSYFTVAVS